MRQFLQHFTRWMTRKTAPALLAGNAWANLSPIDAYRRLRPPSAVELLAELKNTAWTCASINATSSASHPPRLYVMTEARQPKPRCLTRSLDAHAQNRLRASPHLRDLTRKAVAIEEVLEHPLLTLLRQVNPLHNSFDLWEMTQLYLEVIGTAYWLLDFDPLLNIPRNIWILPAHLVTPRREPNSRQLVDYYEFRGATIERFSPERIIAFRIPDPRDPYCSGLSPLRAAFEQVALSSEYAAMKRSLYDNTGLPSVLLAPAEQMGLAERQRLEAEWQQKFVRGGQGKLLIADTQVRMQLLSHSMGDLAALADMKATKEDIANAFHVPLPFLSGDTNLANMQAADHLHKTLAIVPRLRRRDEKLNERLTTLYDPTGRLFLASDDPTPANQEQLLQREKQDLLHGVRTINEVRAERGLTAVAWGDRPWLPSNMRKL